MERSGRNKWRSVRFLPWGEGLEGRQLLSGSWPRYISHGELNALLHGNTPGYPAVRPNTPVLPFGTPSASAPTWIDPTARIVNGYAVIVSGASFVAPYSTLDAHGGIIKIGFGSVILDNASIKANPSHPHTAPAPEVKIGNQVVIGYGAQVLGPSTIGAYGSAAAPTGIGAGAVIDQAVIAPGAYVSALARVEGVTIPAGKLVLPGQTVASATDLLDPTKVVTIQGNTLAGQIVSELNQLRATNLSLAAGYATLYQGNSATGASPGVAVTNTTVFNGNLSAVEGAGLQPSPPGSRTNVSLAPRWSGPGALVQLPRPDDRSGRVQDPSQPRRSSSGSEQLHPRRPRRAQQRRSADQHRLDRPHRFRSHDQCSFERDGRGVHDRPEFPGRYGGGDPGWSRQDYWQQCLDRRFRGRGRKFPRRRLDCGSWSVFAQHEVPGGKQHSRGSDLYQRYFDGVREVIRTASVEPAAGLAWRKPRTGVMKSWSCIEFVFIQLSLTGLPQPRTGRQFIAWGVSPRNPEPSNDDPEPPKGAAEGEAWRCLIATRRSSGSRSTVAPVGGSGPQSWWLPLDFTSPGADAARL